MLFMKTIEQNHAVQTVKNQHNYFKFKDCS
jgi:hypothetical protein